MIDHRYTLTAEVRDEIEALLTRFEQDRERCSVDLNQYTPDRDDPAYGAVVTELSRIDLEYRFGEGGSLDAGEYVERFADVFADRHLRTQLAFEEYRLRRRRGEDVTGTDVASKYDVPGDRWPQLKLGDDEPSGDHHLSAMMVFRRCRGMCSASHSRFLTFS